MPHRIAEALGARLLSHCPLEGGVSASVQALELERGGRVEVLVLRSFPTDPPGEAARRIRQEAALLRHGRAVGLPVPELRWEDAAGAVMGTPAVLMEHLPGTTHIDEEHLPEAIPRIARLLAQVHRAPLPDTPLPERVDPLPELRQWLESLGETDLLERISGLVLPPMPGPPRLVHGDIWPGNLLWKHGVLTGLIDWEDAAVGDPHSDLAGSRVELAVAFGPAAAAALLAASPEPTCPERLAAWDLYASAAALVYMGNWGLAEDVLEARRKATRAFFAEAAARLVPAPAAPG